MESMSDLESFSAERDAKDVGGDVQGIFWHRDRR